MGKASELDDYLETHPLTPDEKARYKRPRPQLRLRSEVVEQALDPDAPVKTALGHVATQQGAEVVALHDAESGSTAVIVPVAQYLELVSSYIRDRELAEIDLNGRAVPSDATFSALGVEQVDPQESWLRIGGRDPGQPPEG